MHPIRNAVAAAVLVVAALALPRGAAAQEHRHDHGHGAATAQFRHPDPRPGVTADKVVPASEFEKKRHRQRYAEAAEIPHILDGIYCHCDCHERNELRSLLSCYENRMASSCGICQGQERMAYRMHQAGKSLEEIRAAIDAEYGPGS